MVVSKKTADNIIKALYYAFHFCEVSKYLLSDNGKAFTNKLIRSFLKEHNVHWYSTYSELMAVVEKRFNLTLREWLDKEKTERELFKEKIMIKEALEKFIEYYYNHKHSTVTMSRIDANKVENKK